VSSATISALTLFPVMAGLGSAIHVCARCKQEDVDGRHTAGHDENGIAHID
jgi:hypothetical protein